MTKHLQLDRPKQLLVEGNDLVNFLYPYLEYLGVDQEIQIQDFGGVTQLPGFLGQLVKHPGYRQAGVRSLGIIRDAEENGASAFQSVQRALERSGLPVPDRVTEVVRSSPSLGVYILPDGDAENMMAEDLFLTIVDGDPALTCVDNYLACLKEVTNVLPGNWKKARFWTYLASKPLTKPLVGYAARSGYLDFQHQSLDGLRGFILSL